MDLLQYISKAFQGGFSTTEIDFKVMVICLLITLILSFYIWMVYSIVNKRSFYDLSFNLSLIVLALVTAAVILTIQSNIVVSLGMVGALSIVRFRTAIKSSIDLVFLFWSISVGIICGAGFALIAVIASLIISIVIIIFSMNSYKNDNLLLVVNMKEYNEKTLLENISNNTSYFKVRARNITLHGTNIAIEIKTKEPEKLINDIKTLEGITNVSLLEHDGDITA